MSQSLLPETRITLSFVPPARFRLGKGPKVLQSVPDVRRRYGEVGQLSEAEVRIGYSEEDGSSASQVGRDVLKVPMTEPTTVYGWDAIASRTIELYRSVVAKDLRGLQNAMGCFL